MRKLLLSACALVVLCGYTKAEDQAAGLDPAKQAEFLDIADELRCPTCTGLSVLESDAPFSNQIKDIVKEQVNAGKPKEEVLKYFRERYGPWILRAPPKDGFNLIAWAVPISILIFGPLLVWFFVWRRGTNVVSGHGVRHADDIINEMHERLDRMRARASGGRA